MSIKLQGYSVFSFGALAALVSACSQAAPLEGTDVSTSQSDALNTVISCQMTDQTCRLGAKSPADVATCEKGLQSCLMSLLPEAGAFPPPTLPMLPTLPRFDGGLPLPTRPTLPPPLRGFDAGFPTPPPITFPDAGIRDQRVCLDDLQRCLFARTDPQTCATDARTCLTAVAEADCDAREKACLDAKLSTTFCDAQRKACR
jgi:hypothetical protein